MAQPVEHHTMPTPHTRHYLVVLAVALPTGPWWVSPYAIVQGPNGAFAVLPAVSVTARFAMSRTGVGGWYAARAPRLWTAYPMLRRTPVLPAPA